METPVLSIFIPVYNAERYLEECLDSVLNQTLFDLEIHIYDDGSADNSYSICQRYALNDSRIHLSKGKNGNSVYKMNEFIKIAKGEYIGFVDNDDFLEWDYFEKMISALKTSGADGAVSSYTYIDSQKNPISWYTPKLKNGTVLAGDEILRRFLTTLEIEGFRWNKIFKKEILQKNNFEFPNVFPADMNGEVVLLSKCESIVLVDNHGYYYRQSATSEVATPNKNNTLSFLETYKRISEDVALYGLEKEGKYFCTWRATGKLFNTWKSRSSYSDWDDFRKQLSWDKWIGQSLFKVLFYFTQYKNEQESFFKFMIKAIIVKIVFS